MGLYDGDTEERRLILNEDTDTPRCYVPRRGIMIILLFFGIVLCYVYRVVLSVAVVPMAKEYHWPESTKGYVLSSFFWGYIVTQLPGGYLATRFGGKTVLCVGIVWPAIFTILTPFSAHSLVLLYACRVLTGLGEGVCYPTLHVLLSHWLPEKERSRYVTFIWGGAYIGTIVAMVGVPQIISHYSWQMAFYFFGLLGIIWGILWMIFSASTPKELFYIHKSEVEYIASNNTKKVDQAGITWEDIKIILRSKHVWGIIINHFCNNWGFYVLLTWLPSYLNKTFSLAKSGFFGVLPFLAMFIMGTLGGRLADFLINYNSDNVFYDKANRITLVRKLMGGVGNTLPALFLIAIHYVHSVNYAIVCLVCAIGFQGLALSGYGVNHLDISPRCAGLLMGLSNTAATIPGILGVILTGYMISATGGWDIVFFLAAGVYLFGVVTWLLMCTGKRVIE